ncbi:MAG: DNA mismatch repair protein MutS [Paludibacteraceae bacterium]
MSSKVKVTPMMRQFNEIKSKHPDAILLFRCGDFYETYSKDAQIAAEILGITLTKRSNKNVDSTEMAGFPHHALDTYLPKLVRAGLRVAICDQLEDPKTAKGIVKRGITELVTPGVATNDTILDVKENNFLAAVYLAQKQAGVSFLDISTGEFLVAEGTLDYVDKLINSFTPKELLYEYGYRKKIEEAFGGNRFHIQEMDDWVFTSEAANDRLTKHFETRNLKGFGVENLTLGTVAAGAVLYYLDQTYHQQISHITHLSRIESERYVWLDRFTVRNLELFGSINENARTLCSVIEKTITPMGSRLLRRWLAFPLKDVQPINDRLSVVSHYFKHPDLRNEINDWLAKVGDLERILSKVAVGRISPREVGQLRVALSSVEPIKRLCEATNNDVLKRFAEQLNPCTTIRDRIERELSKNPPILLNKGNVIAEGVNDELDNLRHIAYSGKDYLLQIQQRESEATSIPSLKIGYNNVFGYYIEVRNTHKDKVPEEWIRKQTLVNAERYITQELKEYEEKILGAEERILALESQLFNDLVIGISEYIPAIQINCNILAQLDVLLSFAKVSEENKYICPIVNDSDVLDIKQGRHPVIEQQLPIGEAYVPNDVYLDSEKQQIIIITGPNMAGKSALLRQTALIVLLAQIGCFVPAESATIGVVDKIFTRVGASDNISAGDSTFMVEMNEAASILNNLSHRSLILFDELGRGTSTYDGISIAWAVIEYIHEHPQYQAKTLFATHYHELNEMEKSYPRIKNYNVSVKEMDNKVIFLRKLVRGGSEHSFGIHVAKIAGMPQRVVKRANEILVQLEQDNRQSVVSAKQLDNLPMREDMQLSFFQLDDPVLEQIRDEIKNADLNNLTPLEALNKLAEIKRIITGK